MGGGSRYGPMDAAPGADCKFGAGAPRARVSFNKMLSKSNEMSILRWRHILLLVVAFG